MLDDILGRIHCSRSAVPALEAGLKRALDELNIGFQPSPFEEDKKRVTWRKVTHG